MDYITFDNRLNLWCNRHSLGSSFRRDICAGSSFLHDASQQNHKDGPCIQVTPRWMFPWTRKTAAYSCGTRYQSASQTLRNGCKIYLADTKSGVFFYADHSFVKRVSNTHNACSFHTRDLAWVKRFFTHNAGLSFANSFVSSRFDCCNSTLYKIPKKYIDRLQQAAYVLFFNTSTTSVTFPTFVIPY